MRSAFRSGRRRKINETSIDTLESQTIVSDYDVEPRDGQPIVQLGRVELILVMLGYAIQFVLFWCDIIMIYF